MNKKKWLKKVLTFVTSVIMAMSTCVFMHADSIMVVAEETDATKIVLGSATKTTSGDKDIYSYKNATITIKNEVISQLAAYGAELTLTGTDADVNSTGKSSVTIDVSNKTADEIAAIIQNATFAVSKYSGLTVTVKFTYGTNVASLYSGYNGCTYTFGGNTYIRSTCLGIPLDTIENLEASIPEGLIMAPVTDETSTGWGGVKQYQFLDFFACGNGTGTEIPSLTDGAYQWNLSYKWVNYTPTPCTDLPQDAIDAVGGDPRVLHPTCPNAPYLTYSYLASKNGPIADCFYGTTKYAAIYMYNGTTLPDNIKELLEENQSKGCTGCSAGCPTEATDTIQPTPTPTPTTTPTPTETPTSPELWCVTFLDCKGNTVSVQWVKTGESAAVPTGFGTYTNYSNITSHRDLRPTSCGVNSGWVVPNTANKSS